MTKGLLKSMFLHMGILMMFIYGAEIFKKNKRFEIYEINLEVVDISEKTVNKTEIKKILQKKKKDKNQIIRQHQNLNLNPQSLLLKMIKKKPKTLKEIKKK